MTTGPTDRELLALSVPDGYQQQSGQSGPFWSRALGNGHTIIIHLRKWSVSVHMPKRGWICWPTDRRTDALAYAEALADNPPASHGGNWLRAYAKVVPGCFYGFRW